MVPQVSPGSECCDSRGWPCPQPVLLLSPGLIIARFPVPRGRWPGCLQSPYQHRALVTRASYGQSKR